MKDLKGKLITLVSKQGLGPHIGLWGKPEVCLFHPSSMWIKKITQSRKRSIMHAQNLWSLSCSSLTFWSLKSTLPLTFLKFYCSVDFLWLVLPKGAVCCQSWAGTERFWEGEKHCTTVAHLFTSAGCEAGSSHQSRTLLFLRNACTWRQRSSSGVPQGKEMLLWITPENGMSGPTSQLEGKHCAMGLGGPLVDEENLTVHEPTSRIYVCVKAGWGIQGLCSTPPRKGKPQKETEMKRKQVNKCGFTETEEQFILSTASENLENIWKSQKTS